MTSTSVERLTRLQKIYPEAIGQGVIEGSQHLVRRELRIWERRGEVIGLRRFEQIDRRAGTTRIPYVRLKTQAQVRRERLVGALPLAAAGMLFLGVVCWVAWEARYVALGVAGMMTLGAAALRFAPHWRKGCTGLHCPGCGG